MAVVNETLKQIKAFEYYYKLGEKRNAKKVADKFKVSVSAVYTWSKTFNWKERVIERDKDNAKWLIEKTNSTVVQDLVEFKRIIKDSISRYADKLGKGKVDITTSDLIRLMSMYNEILEILDDGTITELKTSNSDDNSSGVVIVNTLLNVEESEE